MHNRFPIATFAAMLPTDQRDTFAHFARTHRNRLHGFIKSQMDRAERGLSLRATPER